MDLLCKLFLQVNKIFKVINDNWDLKNKILRIIIIYGCQNEFVIDLFQWAYKY